MMSIFIKNILRKPALITMGILFFTAPAVAQTNDLTLRVLPQTPEPGENIIIEVVSFKFDTRTADFKWFLNGKEVASGIGKTKETFRAGPLGSQTTIRVTARTSGNATYEGSVVVRVGAIDIIVVPLTSTPALYRGSAIPTPGSVVELYAVAHLFVGGKKINPESLIYEWIVEDLALVDESGGGKNKLILPLSNIRNKEYSVQVVASTRGGEVRATRSAIVRAREPFVLFYEFHPLSGLSRIARSIFSPIPGSKTAMKAEPFFFDRATLSDAQIVWKANNEPLSSLERPYILELSTPEGEYGKTVFSFEIKNVRKIFQRASASFTVEGGTLNQ